MKNLKFILPLLGLAYFPVLAFASVCDSKSTVTTLLQQTGKYNEGSYYDCRALPHQSGFSMLALAQFIPDQNDSSEGQYFIHLFKIQDQSKKIVQQYRDSESYVSDAIALRGIKLDTAAYQLNPQQRAIGIRIDYQGPSRVYPYYSSNLSLYNFEKRQRILTGLTVDLGRGENDSACNGEWENHKTVLHMLGSQSKGYADIRVTANIKSFETRMIKDECSDVNEKKDQTSFVMKFDGQQYQIPKPFSDIYQY